MSHHSITVPDGVYRMIVRVWGAGGGGRWGCWDAKNFRGASIRDDNNYAGGSGGYMSAEFKV